MTSFWERDGEKVRISAIYYKTTMVLKLIQKWTKLMKSINKFRQLKKVLKHKKRAKKLSILKIKKALQLLNLLIDFPFGKVTSKANEL